VTNVVDGVIVKIPPFVVVIGIWLPLAVAVKVNVAVWLVLTVAVPLVGVTVMALIPPRNTVAVAVPLTACAFAVIVVVPNENPCSVLLVGLVNEATDGSELDHVTPLPTWPVLPSL
jgi:hypothetical protein